VEVTHHMPRRASVPKVSQFLLIDLGEQRTQFAGCAWRRTPGVCKKLADAVHGLHLFPQRIDETLMVAKGYFFVPQFRRFTHSFASSVVLMGALAISSSTSAWHG